MLRTGRAPGGSASVAVSELRLAVHPKPCDIEGQVIEALAPPLNLAVDRRHPFAWTLSEARHQEAPIDLCGFSS